MSNPIEDADFEDLGSSGKSRAMQRYGNTSLRSNQDSNYAEHTRLPSVPKRRFFETQEQAIDRLRTEIAAKRRVIREITGLKEDEAGLIKAMESVKRAQEVGRLEAQRHVDLVRHETELAEMLAELEIHQAKRALEQEQEAIRQQKGSHARNKTRGQQQSDEEDLDHQLRMARKRRELDEIENPTPKPPPNPQKHPAPQSPKVEKPISPELRNLMDTYQSEEEFRQFTAKRVSIYDQQLDIGILSAEEHQDAVKRCER